jgi:GNAT superfamily N-acetyltransferase
MAETVETIDGDEKLSLLPLGSQSVREVSNELCSMDPWLSMGYRPEALEFYLLRADPALSRYSIMVSEKLAGVLAVRFPWLFGPFIELLAVFDGFRGKGIGARVVHWVCRNDGASNAWVTVSAFNLGAQRFYGRMGFEITAALDDLIKPGWSEILLRKKTTATDGGFREQQL